MTNKIPEVGVKMLRHNYVAIDWGALAKSSAKSGFHLLLTLSGIPTAAGGVIGNLASAADAVSFEDEPGYQAWQLFALSLGWSLDEMAQKAELDLKATKSKLKEILERLNAVVDSGEAVVPPAFLGSPTSLPVYQLARQWLVDAQEIYRVTRLDPLTLASQWDIAFNRGVFEVFARRPDIFGRLAAALHAPGADSTINDLQWERYRRLLVHEFEVRPVFGKEREKVSLGQLYIPLRAKWLPEGAASAIDEEDVERGAGEERYGSLDDVLDEWVRTESDDAIRLIGGGPGSGKSTSLRAFSRRLAEEPSFRPLFIPLQHIDIGGELRDAVNKFFSQMTDSPFEFPPLNRSVIQETPTPVIIFDGLDEISRPGDAADTVAQIFVTKLTQLLTMLRGDRGRQVKIVIGGRMPSFQAVSKYLDIPHEAKLEVLGYAPISDEDYDDDLLKLDQRGSWWQKYASATDLDSRTPEALSDPRLAEVTNEPLLCYLLALSGFATSDWETAAANRNVIYEKLIDEIWQRGWGEGAVGAKNRRQGPGKTTSKLDFNRLMETIALAAWLGGDARVASDAAFQQALSITRCSDEWASFAQENGPDVTNLAMNFYLKTADARQRGFEFTHKSFGEYLAARAILRVGRDIEAVTSRYMDAAVSAWLRATSTGVLSHEVLKFLRDEVRLRLSSSAELPKLKSAFESIASLVLQEGFPIVVNESMTWRMAESRQVNSERVLWAMLNSLYLAQDAALSDEDRRLKIIWPDPVHSLRALVLRLFNPATRGDPIQTCFAGLSARNSGLFALPTESIVFTGSDLTNSNFSGSWLSAAQINNCKLDGSRFLRCSLDRTNFSGSSLNGVYFEFAKSDAPVMFNSVGNDMRLNHYTLFHWRLTDLEGLLANEGGALERLSPVTFVGDVGENFAERVKLVTDRIFPEIGRRRRKSRTSSSTTKSEK